MSEDETAFSQRDAANNVNVNAVWTEDDPDAQRHIAWALTVLVVDDDRRFRNLAKTVVERAGFAVVEAGSADEALAEARIHLPHLVLLDVKLPQISGYELYHQLRERLGADFPIIFVSGERTEPYDRVAGLLLGADDYLVKPLDPDELVARVRRSLRPHGNGRQSEADRTEKKGASDLTPRELEVLQLVARGLSSAQIAHELVISPRTVGTHIQHILAKLGVANRTEAAAYAFRTGLVEAEVDAQPQAARPNPPVRRSNPTRVGGGRSLLPIRRD